MTPRPTADGAGGTAPDPRALDGVARDLGGRGAGSAVVGVGIDAVDIDRFRAVLGRRTNLGHRLFSDAERAYAAEATDPVPRLATRFAAKEAVMKVLGVGLWAFALRDVEVVRDGLGAPEVVLRGSAADLARAAGATRWHLSLTHTDDLALAVVVAEDGHAPPAGRALGS